MRVWFPLPHLAEEELGGDGGGTIVAQGTPEQVAQVPESYTGVYLAHVLGIPRAKAV